MFEDNSQERKDLIQHIKETEKAEQKAIMQNISMPYKYYYFFLIWGCAFGGYEIYALCVGQKPFWLHVIGLCIQIVAIGVFVFFFISEKRKSDLKNKL